MSGRFKYLGSKQSCNVCGEKGKDCRELHDVDKIIYFCRGDNPSPDYHYLNLDKSGVWQMYIDKALKEAQDQENEEERERQRQEYIAKRKAEQEAEAKRYAEGLPIELRERSFRKLLAQLPLHPHHRADLERRGLTPEQIEKGMFRSVSSQGTKLDNPISQLLPGAWDWGKSFKTTKDGYLCPIFNEQGLIIGAQVRANNTDDGHKYSWLKTKKSSHLQNGELPLTIHIAEGDKNLRLAEGILKPYVANCRRGQTYLGAAGGNFASSPQQLKQYIDYVQPDRVILTPDAGARANKNVLRQYRAIAKLLKSWNLTLWVEDWGQADSKKGNFDVDEISPDTATNIIPFSKWDLGEFTPKWVARRVDGIHKFANDIKKRITPITPTEPKTISFCQNPTQQLANKLGETLIGCNDSSDFLYNERGLLKILENHDKSIPLRLYPEVGYQGKNKLKPYFKLQSFLLQKGYELEIGWWEQWHKNSTSIEDCLVDDIKYISWQEFKHNNRYSKLCYKESKKFTPTKEFSDRYLDGKAIAKMIAPRSLTGIKAAMGCGKTTSIEEILKLHGTRDAFIKTLEKQIHQQEIHLKVAESEIKNCTLFKAEQLGILQANVEKLKAELEETIKQLETEKALSLVSANKGAFLIAHRNNLLLQNKEKLGFLHLRFDDAYHKTYNQKSWLAFCIDSLCKLDYECLEDRIVFLDEISNLIPHFLSGSTCRKFRREILDKFVYLLQHAHAVVVMDANLKDWEFNYIKELGNFSSCNKLANIYQKQPLNITSYEGTIDEKGIIRANDFDTLADKILTDYGLGEVLIIPCDSQKKCEYLHEYLGGVDNPEIIRIDASTVAEDYAAAFISNPNKELKEKGYKVLIYSPSMDSGVSIDLINYFTKGYSINVTLGAEAFSQMPGRLRDNIPWVHYSKTLKRADELASSDPTKVGENILANAYDDIKLAYEKIEEGKQLIREGHQLLERSNDLHYTTYCKVEAQNNYEAKNLREAYYEKLLEDGHNVRKILVPKLGKSAQWQQAKEDVVRRNSELTYYADDIDLIEAEKIYQELSVNVDKQRAAKKAILTKSRLPGLADTEVWSPALLAFLDYSDRDCISRLELRHLLNNPELELCRQSAWYHNLNLGANNGKIMLQDLRSPQLKARMLRDIGLLDFINNPNRFYDGDSPEIQTLIRRANHWRRQRYLGRRGNLPAMKYINRILAKVGYKFVAKKHKGKRMYQIADIYEQVNVSVYNQKLRISEALAPIIASKYAFQLSKAEEYIQQVTQGGTEEPNISIQVCSVPNGEAYTNSSVEIKLNNPLDLYAPPQEYLSEQCLNENEVAEVADLGPLLLSKEALEGVENPLETFKNTIKIWGWQLTKAAAALNQELAETVRRFADQLVQRGEWRTVF